MSAKFKIGQTAAVSVLISSDLVDSFAKLSGDHNPIHMDDKVAKAAGYGKRVVHGMVGASFVSNLIGNQLPGPGALWLEQSFNFLKPIRIGDELRICGTVTKVWEAKSVLQMQIEIHNQKEESVLTGTGIISFNTSIRNNELDNPIDHYEGSKNIVVFGATGDIGSALCTELAKQNYEIFFQYFDNKSKAEVLKDKLIKAGSPYVSYLQADVSNEKDLRKITSFLEKSGKGWLNFVHLAGEKITECDCSDLIYEDFVETLQIQLKSSMHMSKFLVPKMRAETFGRIIYVSSAETIAKASPTWVAYGIAKTATQTYFQYLAKEVGKFGITVNCILPHMIDTQYTQSISPLKKNLIASKTSLGTLCKVEDVVTEIIHKLNRSASGINGKLIEIGG